jgi:hypothetical protein
MRVKYMSLWFWFAFLWYLVMLGISSCLYWLFLYHFWRNTYI